MVDLAVLNTSEEVAEAIEAALRAEGWSTAAGYTIDFKRGRADLTAFLREHDPRVVVWDIAFPYAENWAFYQEAHALPAMQGRRIVLTTVNQRALERVAGEAAFLELLDRPVSFDALRATVRAALAASPP
jgi:DNA-binding response OmpR family regulator